MQVVMISYKFSLMNKFLTQLFLHYSDEAIAAFLEITGESMKELSLNNIKKVYCCTSSPLVHQFVDVFAHTHFKHMGP